MYDSKPTELSKIVASYLSAHFKDEYEPIGEDYYFDHMFKVVEYDLTFIGKRSGSKKEILVYAYFKQHRCFMQLSAGCANLFTKKDINSMNNDLSAYLQSCLSVLFAKGLSEVGSSTRIGPLEVMLSAINSVDAILVSIYHSNMNSRIVIQSDETHGFRLLGPSSDGHKKMIDEFNSSLSMFI